MSQAHNRTFGMIAAIFCHLALGIGLDLCNPFQGLYTVTDIPIVTYDIRGHTVRFTAAQTTPELFDDASYEDCVRRSITVMGDPRIPAEYTGLIDHVIFYFAPADMETAGMQYKHAIALHCATFAEEPDEWSSEWRAYHLLTHELGHAVELYRYGGRGIVFADLYTESPEDFCLGIQQESPAEDFAQSFSCYVFLRRYFIEDAAKSLVLTEKLRRMKGVFES